MSNPMATSAPKFHKSNSKQQKPVTSIEPMSSGHLIYGEGSVFYPNYRNLKKGLIVVKNKAHDRSDNGSWASKTTLIERVSYISTLPYTRKPLIRRLRRVFSVEITLSESGLCVGKF